MYVCGITPYDATHVGHAATYVTFDVLLRALRDAGHEVRYIQNVTDVDDPLLARAARDGVDWTHLAAQETRCSARTWRLWRSSRRTITSGSPRASASSSPPSTTSWRPARHTGCRSDAPGYDVYLDVPGRPGFGDVSGATRAQMLALSAERGGDPNGPASETRSTRCSAGRSRGRAVLGRRPARRRPPGMAHRVHVDRRGVPRYAVHRPGRGHRPDLPPPRDERRAGLCAHRGRPLRRGVHPPGDGRSRRGEDEQVPGQPGPRVRPAPPGRGPDGDPPRAAGPPLPVRVGVERGGPDRSGRAPAEVAGGLVGHAGPDAWGAVRAIREALADDLDTPSAIGAVDTWARRCLDEGGDQPAAPGCSPGRSTRCSGSL